MTPNDLRRAIVGTALGILLFSSAASSSAFAAGLGCPDPGPSDEAVGMTHAVIAVLGGIEAANASDLKAVSLYADKIAKVAKAQGAHVLLSGHPLETYEREWSAGKTVTVLEWPCRQAALAFWRSDAAIKIALQRPSGGQYVAVLYGIAKDRPRDSTGLWHQDKTPSQKCARPVYHVTVGDVTAPERLPVALPASELPTDLDVLHSFSRPDGFYHRYGGVPVASGAPDEMLEGAWPSNRSLLVTRWPCRAAFEAWYLTPPYSTRLKQFRLAAGEYTLMLFDGIQDWR